MSLIVVMGLALSIVLPVAIYIIYVIDQKDKMKDNIGASLAVKRSKYNLTYTIYRYLIRLPLTRNYIDKIKRRYEYLYPGEPKEITKKAVKTTLLTWSLCAFAVGLLVIKSPSFNNLIVGLILIYVINNEIISFMVNRTEIRLLEDMAVFISNVRHNYHINRMVDDAILLSLDGLNYEMKVHAYKIYEIVTSNNLKDDVLNYNATVNNKYLKIFLSLCTSILEFSDKVVKGQLLFTSNLENLKKEINIEILKQRRLRYLFSGVTFVTIAVIIPIDGIKKFGVSMMPELSEFYNGRFGIIFAAATMLSSLIIYLLNNRLKESRRVITTNYYYLKKIEDISIIKKALDNYSEKHYGKIEKQRDLMKRIGEMRSPRQLLIQRVGTALIAFIISTIFLFYIHDNNKTNLATKVLDTSFSTVTNQNQIHNIKTIILQKVNTYRSNKDITEELILNEITKEGGFYNTKINEAISKEIMRRVTAYRNEYIKWYEFLICIMVSAISYYIPYFMILYKKKVLQMNMEDEVNQFNSIIYMMMYIDHVTVKELLEELETFSLVFKRTLQECINDYNSGDIEALERMKEKESYGPFRRLVDNLIRCDSISIDKAFDEISSDRENYHDRRRQENEISVQKRADIAKPLSWIPVAMILAYLTLPLMIASLKELEGFSEAINNI